MAQRYILMPALHPQAVRSDNPKVKAFLVSLGQTAQRGGTRTAHLAARSSMRKPPAIPVKVVNSIREDGAKLVEIADEKLSEFRFSYPGLRIIPEVFYERAFIRPVALGAQQASVGRSRPMKITVTDETGNPVKGVLVQALTDIDRETGADGYTDAAGAVTLLLKRPQIQRFSIYTDHTYWGYCQKDIDRVAELTIKLRTIDTSTKDALRHFYPTADWPLIRRKVRIGVIDTGAGPHHDLQIQGGANMITGAQHADYADEEGHGTHVAGIIGARGVLTGVAAGVEIYAYKVFPKGAAASNFDIMNAIDRAVQDKCDLINLSLVTNSWDEGIVSQVKNAYSAGTLCFAANGNDLRQAVGFPASYSLTIAVAACGRKALLPQRTISRTTVKGPYGHDSQDFIADFSNVGPETNLVAPGVGILSTFPGNRYAVMDGTSMACPAAVGMAARLLAGEERLWRMARRQERADEMLKFLATKIKSLGFGANFEGNGMLFP